jgi:hypothetical protein
MPNYEIVKAFCTFVQKEAVFPATYVAEHRGTGKYSRCISDCLSKESKCKEKGCKYAGGSVDPAIQLPH